VSETSEEMDERVEKMIEEKGTFIKNCARCGGDHQLEFEELQGEVIEALEGEYSHFATCPKTGQPIVQMRAVKRGLIEDIPRFTKELTSLLNCHNMDSFTNTPDFLLAEHLMNVIGQIANLHTKRDAWHRKDRPVEPWSENEAKTKE
jgi:hypothetical protein